VCDLDEYRSEPFILHEDRLPGLRRFMVPEEFRRRAQIDQVTNVYALGRTGLILLGDVTDPLTAWRGTAAMREVALRAIDPDRAGRHPSVRAFVEDWRQAVAGRGPGVA
jgi:serine/threonine-protein kinase